MYQPERIFNYESSKVRTVTLNGEPWFVAKDVCNILEVNPTATRRLDGDDKNTLHLTQGNGRGNPNVTVINESGLYSLIMSSRKPEARAFKRWVTSEVLPSIRKHGAYMTDCTLERVIGDPDFMIGLLTELKTERTRRTDAERTITDMQPKVTYYDMILQSKNTVTVTQVAKDYGLTAAELNSILFAERVQYRVGTQWVPYRNHDGKGYTKSDTIFDSYGTARMTTKWTQKGRLFIHDLLTKRGVRAISGQPVAHAI